MHRPLFTLLVVLGVSCTSAPHDVPTTTLQVLPRLGSEFVSSRVAAAIHGRHVYQVVVAGSSFAVAVNPSTRRVISISTRESAFQSPEGAQVGDPVSSLSRLGGQWRSEPAVGCILVLPSGWQALVPATASDSERNRVTPTENIGASAPTVTLEAVSGSSCPPVRGSVSQLFLESDDGA